MRDLFDDLPAVTDAEEPIAPGAVLLRGAACTRDSALLEAIETVIARAPLRHMVTPGGYRMSVAMSNCGPYGWVSTPSGYRYDPMDPVTGRHWPAMPPVFLALAAECARRAGFAAYEPQACLINRYAPGARLSLHQDRDEQDRWQPIVSVSLGLPAVFVFGGFRRRDPVERVPLAHGDVVVWGGPARMRYHGVLAVRPGEHRLTGPWRLNLTFRRVTLTAATTGTVQASPAH